MAQRGHVLIVDDSAAVRRLLRDPLEAEGYAVQEAPDGLAAFLVLSRRVQRYVVLLDYVMPTMDGWKLLQLASKDSRLLSQHAYIFMTAPHVELPPALVAFLTRYTIPLLHKPLHRECLSELVAQACRCLAEEPSVPSPLAPERAHAS
jgi:CheY-like chemotaxis protein